MLPAQTAQAKPRRRYLDWARGLAVLIMIQAHALDAWTHASARSGTTFAYLTMLGGLAAPLFLWLAGLAFVLAAEQMVTRTGQRRRATEEVVRRGTEIFVLAFLFRLQAFVVSPGNSLVTLFRVDILNVMGPAIVGAGILWGLTKSPVRIALASAAVACGIAMVTPLIRTAAWVSGLPVWIQWYLRPSGEHTTFTLFPWAGFVFAGAACGAVLSSGHGTTQERRLVAALALAGALLVATGFYAASLPSIYPASSFWTSSPTYFMIRAGLLMLALAVFFWLAPLAESAPAPFNVLERFGRNSLFVYWIHVELVYGYATWAIHRRLPVWGTVIAYVLFCVAMYRAVDLRDKLAAAWRSRRSPSSAARATSG